MRLEKVARQMIELKIGFAIQKPGTGSNWSKSLYPKILR